MIPVSSTGRTAKRPSRGLSSSSSSIRYHRRFIEVANSEYISKLNGEEKKTIFQNMIDLYKETWKGKSKPFKIGRSQPLE